jgi:hypothetical protein
LVNFFISVVARPLVAGLAAAGLLALSACATKPPADGAVVAPTAVLSPAFVDAMTAAEEAQKAGNHAEALSRFEAATKADPSKKQPWLRIAQLQFDARNYGPAITAAQEVLQRDTADTTAQSILAVSGLRVSAAALDQLRKANAIVGSTRGEAQALARTLRESLGESILPANAGTASANSGANNSAAADAAAKPAARPAAAPRRVAAPAAVVARPAAAPASAAAPAKAAPAAAAPAAKRNPFDALK